MDGRAKDQTARATGKFSTLDWATSAAAMENPCRKSKKFFSRDFLAVALFSGGGLVITLIAIIFTEQGIWL